MNKPPNLRNEPTCINCAHFEYNMRGYGYACKKYNIKTEIIYRCDELKLLKNTQLNVKTRPIIETTKYIVK